MGLNNSKTCNNCGISLTLSDYYKYQLKEDNPICKACVKANRKKPDVPDKLGGKDKLNKIDKKSKLRGLYVISTLERASVNLYKVGKHSGTQRALISRYKTYLINPIIYFYTPRDDIDIFETEILGELSEYRMHDDDGGDTEWVKLPLEKLLPIIINKL